jgi:hypothetical protein
MIVASKRKKREVRQGERMLVEGGSEGIVIKPTTPIEQLASADATKVGLEQMRKKLDDIRGRDRY